MRNLDSQGLGGVSIHQRERLFHTRCNIANKACQNIIDGESGAPTF